MLPHSQRFFRDYLPGHGVWYFWGLLFLVLNVAAIVTIPVFLDRVVTVLETATATNEFSPATRDVIRTNALTIIGLGIGLAIFRILSRVVLFVPGRRIEARLRQDYFGAITDLSPDQISRYQIGDLIARGTNDVNTSRVMLSMGVLHSVNAVLLMALSLFFMLRLSVWLTLVGLVFGPLLLMFVKRMSRLMMDKQRSARRELAELSETIRETFRAHTLMAVYPVFRQILARFEEHNRLYCEKNIELVRLRVPLFVSMGSFTDINQTLLLLIGGWMIMSGSGSFTVSNLIVFSVYLGLVQEPMRSGGFIISLFQRGEVSLERLYELYDEAGQARIHSESREISSSQHLENGRTGDAPLIQVRDLSFAYQAEGHQPFTLVIPDLSLVQGRRYGIFGSVGCGKSTLLSILSGSQPVPRGHLFLDGMDYADIDEEVLISQFSIAQQESRHFARTIRENIELVSSNERWQQFDSGDSSVLGFDDAYEVSQLASDVERFEDGLDAILGEDGLNLSGGQKQRLAIMRALVKPHRVLMLDDIVSAVDHHTEKRILEELYRILENQCLIFVSHRISALMPCDEILVMENGRIVARGSHSELLKTHDTYRRTWEHQVLEQTLESSS